MNLIDESKLQAAGDELIDRLKTALASDGNELLERLDGWTLTITLRKPVATS